MYNLDWIARIKFRNGGSSPGRIGSVSPTVWKLGLTSLLTDISSEMMNSLLPVYLVLHLHMSPLQFGAIDGIYNGFAVAILGLAGGIIADRTRRPKEVAFFGYGLSAVCKLLLLFAGATFGWIAAIVALDRAGKGARTAPRDSMISLCTAPSSLAVAFGVHRAMDAVGAILGPVFAFVLLTQIPGRFDAIWVTSFAFAVLGLAVLLLFVQNPPTNPAHGKKLFRRLTSGYFWKLSAIGLLLSAMTVSDGFLYLLLQRRCNLTLGFFPLFYVVTAAFYMLLAIPLGQLADRHGRKRIFFSGYVAIALIYVWLLTTQTGNLSAILLCLFLFGFYYAATEGVLTAMASSIIPAESRTSGLAILGTAISAGKFGSSLLFGFFWQHSGTQTALSVSLVGLSAALLVSMFFLRKNPAAIRA